MSAWSCCSSRRHFWNSLLFASGKFSVWFYVSLWGLLVFHERAYSMDSALCRLPAVRRSFISQVRTASLWYCFSTKLISPLIIEVSLLIIEVDPCATPIILHVLLLSRCCPLKSSLPGLLLSRNLTLCLHLLARYNHPIMLRGGKRIFIASLNTLNLSGLSL